MATQKSPPMFLLLLPPLSTTTVSYSNLSRAYSSPLSAALHVVATTPNTSTRPAILEIALACPYLNLQPDLPRSHIYADTQTLLAGVYKLICVICAREGIDTAGSGGVDARILTLVWKGDQNETHIEEPDGKQENSQGVIISLATLIGSMRPWSTVFTVDDVVGERMRDELNRHSQLLPREPAWKFQRVAQGESIEGQNDQTSMQSQAAKEKEHCCVAVGGTFDHLHAGHKLLLTMTALLVQPLDGYGTYEQDRRMIVGISGDTLLQNKAFAEYMCGWEERQRDVSEFITAIADFTPRDWAAGTAVTKNAAREPSQAIAKRLPGFWLDCVEIADPYGPTVTVESISALVVSAETHRGGQAVNEKRRKKGWPTLDIFEVDVLSVQDGAGNADDDDDVVHQGFASKISSTEIRRQLSATRTGAGPSQSPMTNRAVS